MWRDGLDKVKVKSSITGLNKMYDMMNQKERNEAEQVDIQKMSDLSSGRFCK